MKHTRSITKKFAENHGSVQVYYAQSDTQRNFMQNVSEKTHREYKEFSCVLQKVKRAARKQYYENKCVEFRSNTKKLWQIINEVTGKTNDKDGLIDSLKINNTHEYEAKKIANAFRKYFSSVGEKFANKIPKPKQGIELYLKMIRNNVKSLFLSPCTCREVQKLITKLPGKASSGYDNINNLLLKNLGPASLIP